MFDVRRVIRVSNALPLDPCALFLQPASQKSDKTEDLDIGAVEDKVFAEL